jgi:hypothetical protein
VAVSQKIFFCGNANHHFIHKGVRLAVKKVENIIYNTERPLV